jgi:hypothetical protein
MKLNFRIDWGYQYLYSRRHYHPVYVWDGDISCRGGSVEKVFQLDYPVIWFGPGHCAKETLLPAASWKSRTKRGMAGVRIEAEADENAVFHLNTASGSFSFTAKDILEKGRIQLPVGPKYLGCFITVTNTGYYWFRQPLKEGQVALEPEQLGLPVHNWARMHLAWLAPGQTVEFTWEQKDTGADLSELLIHMVLMGVPDYTTEKETQVSANYPFTLLCDGQAVRGCTRYLRDHDIYMQILEDEWQRLALNPGKHTVGIRNDHPEYSMGFSRIVLQQCDFRHGQLSMPRWALVGETLHGCIWSAREEKLALSADGKEITVDAVPGWNEFPICLEKAGDFTAVFGEFTAKTEVYDIPEEEIPVKVGYDMTVVPHDDNGLMDWLLDYTQRTRLGNYVVFRNFGLAPVRADQWQRWGEYCRDHGIWVSSCTEFLEGTLAKAAGDKLHDMGTHEFPGKVYAFDPEEPWQSDDMKQAMEHYIAHLKTEIDPTHGVCPVMAFGDASGGIRYSYMAGVDFVRAETMVGHTQVLLSQARPAAQALGDGRWGVHIAIQHHYQPYQHTHLGQYFLSLMQPWVMGAETIYEEDCLFNMFKEERMAWDDSLTKGKRDMTRQFFKFAKTHPRKGENIRNIAFLEGRYAAPFNGFICDSEQDPHYSVWGLYGNPDPTWGHGQPEKCRQVLDVLMPGASTQPFRQKFDKRRFFFSGTPYGDFDCIPVEAEDTYFNQYRLLLNLGWHSANPEDTAKLHAFAENGGVLLTGIPQFSTHIRRQFLADMEDLSLDCEALEALCGIRVLGKGESYCGQWNCSGRRAMEEPELSAMPSDSPDEDGEALLARVELLDAEVVAWDTFTGAPMLVRKPLGKGWVYTFTLWAYPGHERFQKFCAAWVQQLAKDARGDFYAEDPSGEVFWTIWNSGEEKRMYLLNTDWSEPGNGKEVILHWEGQSQPMTVREGVLTVVTVGKNSIHAEELSL